MVAGVARNSARLKGVLGVDIPMGRPFAGRGNRRAALDAQGPHDPPPEGGGLGWVCAFCGGKDRASPGTVAETFESRSVGLAACS